MNKEIKQLVKEYLRGDLKGEQLKQMDTLLIAATKHNDSFSNTTLGFEVLKQIKNSSADSRYEIEEEIESKIVYTEQHVSSHWANQKASQSFLDEIVADAKSHDFKNYVELLMFAQSVQFKYVFDNLWDGLEKIIKES